jgi:hypothetical protein
MGKMLPLSKIFAYPFTLLFAGQIFIALGGGALVICEQLAAMAATSHQYVAVVLAVEVTLPIRTPFFACLRRLLTLMPFALDRACFLVLGERLGST